MYTEVEGFPCVRLLNLSGEIGCSNPGRGNVVAPLVRFKNAKELTGPATILVSIDEFESLLSRVSKDSEFAEKVVGILVESGTQIQNGLSGFSPDVKFPQAAFAPYQSNNFEWNPAVALRNEESKSSYPKVVSEFDLVMQTTKSATRDSNSCLKEGTCLPLGGYRPVGYCSAIQTVAWPVFAFDFYIFNLKGSVWSALPPINISSPVKSKPIVLTMTSMDSASFFRDKNLGAESPISGLIALLAVVDALSHLDGLKDLNKQEKPGAILVAGDFF